MALRDERLQQVVASQAAGAVSTFVVCPLDTVRYRFMSQDGTSVRTHNGRYYTRTIDSLRHIVKEEGVAALFRGGHIAVFGASASWGIYMYAYRTGQAMVYGMFTANDPRHVFLVDTAISSAASLSNALLTTPIWLIKTRMQVEDNSMRAGSTTQRHYSSFLGGVRHTVRSEGVMAMWKGVNVQLAMSAANAVYFPLYEMIKRCLLRSRPSRTSDRLEHHEVVVCSAVSKSAIAFATNPMFVLRTRLQDARSTAVPKVQYVGAVQSAKITYAREGIGGFFRGVVPSVTLTAPRAALCMVLMEHFAGELKLRYPNQPPPA
jgi:solute carrier family 25 folate transporter 32